MPTRRGPRGSFPVELLVFLAILTTGIILILVGHISPEALAGYASALTGLYTAWRHYPRSEEPQRTPPQAPPAPEP
ncbi:hypothetical protein WDV06_09285 [Streptomyces racemochromogenes]|uniref:Uncharacterized protein n=1 Tax=Streptomyces racemochromogenes TaxID=67353 RepID=A0ABW7PA86_9ACTN